MGITDSDVKCIRLAGLTHDLGHGPFSHLFDGLFIPEVRKDINWTHEDASQAMLQHICLERPGLDITPEEVSILFLKQHIALINSRFDLW